MATGLLLRHMSANVLLYFRKFNGLQLVDRYTRLNEAIDVRNVDKELTVGPRHTPVHLGNDEDNVPIAWFDFYSWFLSSMPFLLAASNRNLRH
jgi:hypothetical protein